MKSGGKILSTNLFPVVGIGASAGGLDAFKKLIKAIPENSGMAYVLVQHLDPTHESLLPELLQKVTTIPVLEIVEGVKVEPNHIYILPSNKMLVANDGILQISPRPTNKSEINLPIDLFFNSLAEVHQNQAIGVVLSGTGSDGTKGLKAIKENEGITFAQDINSAAYTSMPQSAIQAGVIDFILSPEQIPQKLVEITRIINQNGDSRQTMLEEDNDVFKQMLSVLRIRKGADFTYYKQTTIRRRILRRMAINKNETPNDYLTYLRKNKSEQDALYQDLLISVTTFFRDPKIFDTLCETVFPLIIKNKPAGEPIRVWVAGCSTGEEAYSIAICFKEFLGDNPERVQIFATDLSELAIAKARTGIYTKKEVDTVTAQRLQEFFTKTKGSYQVNKQVRDMCVFAHQNFIKDPPFGKIDFVSCRNVLIYMEPYLQKKALTTFHYALNENGFLLLGKSETISSVPDLFTVAQKNDKLFTRKNVPGKFMHIASQRSELNLSHSNTSSNSEINRTDYQKTADEIILRNYTPAGVIVNEAMDIVHFRGNTTPYLEQSPGKPTHNLLLMAKHGLAFELRNLLHKVKKEKTSINKDNIPLQADENLRAISIEVIPLPNTIEPYYLVLFYDTNSLKNKVNSIEKVAAKLKKDDKDHLILQLKQELAQAREDMRGITQDQEAVNEELQSANEELLSSNEELQSLNEELETSKEEQQSANEELTIINQEIISLNEQVTAARDYAEAIIANIREPLLVLDKTLRVKMANNAFYKTFHVNELETEDVLIYDLGNKQWDIPELRVLLERILPEKSTFTGFELTYTFSVIGTRIMLLNAREILNKNSLEKLILLSIEDITEATKARDIEKKTQKQLQFIADAMPQKVWTADANGNANYFNQTWLTYTGLIFEELKDLGWKKIIHPDDYQENQKRWQHSIRTGTTFEMEHRLRNTKGEYKWHLSRSVAQKDENGDIIMWIGTNTENHEQRSYQEELEKSVAKRTYELQFANETLGEKNKELQQMNKELESFTYISSHDLQEPLRKIQTFAGHILESENQNLTENGKDSFRRMQLAAARMQQLIRDLLDFSRVNTAERIFEPTDLTNLVTIVVSELKETIEQKHAIIDATKLGTATIIGFQFRQLMHNLISNSLKFSNPAIPPHIVIKSSLAKGSEINNEKISPEKNYCHITVSDNGIGFEPQYSERIFNVFKRLHNKGQYNGTGIGLAIVKKIIENHNGLITATSQLNQGATFDIYIPDSRLDR